MTWKEKKKKLKLRRVKAKAHFYIDWCWKFAGIPRAKVYADIAQLCNLDLFDVHLQNVTDIARVNLIKDGAKKYRERYLARWFSKLESK